MKNACANSLTVKGTRFHISCFGPEVFHWGAATCCFTFVYKSCLPHKHKASIFRVKGKGFFMRLKNTSSFSGIVWFGNYSSP